MLQPKRPAYSKEWKLFMPGLNWQQVTSAERKRLCCSFVLYHFTQQKRGKTLCLIAIDKRLNDVGKSEINWLQMWITFLARIINSSMRMLQQVLGSDFTKKFAPRNMAKFQLHRYDMDTPAFSFTQWQQKISQSSRKDPHII